ncbi:MAG: MarR family transcriptional regulator [Clostridia bacterium]|nr:MarR family transcriptional regulator [Clostridia bacterium]
MDKYTKANIIFSKFSRDYMELKKDLPIRASEMGVLNIIVKREGLFTPLMIAELLEVSKPMVTSHITILEKKGYVVRQSSKEDKRSFYVIPTNKAKDLVKATTLKVRSQLSMLEKSLGENAFNNLIELLIKAHDSIKNIKGE